MPDLRPRPRSGSVLVADDGSDRGADALALGRRLARWLDRELVVAVAYDAFALSSRHLVEARREDAARIAARDAPAGGRDRAEVHVVGGPDPAETLCDLARRLEAGVLVVGRSHHRRLPSGFGGSTTRRVLLDAPVAVAIAPSGARPGPDVPFRRIALALRGGPGSRAWLGQAGALARAAGAELEIVTASGTDAPLLVRERLETQLVDAARQVPDDVVCHVRLLEGPPRRALRELHADTGLLVLGSPASTPVQRAWLGDTALDLAEDPPCPLLVLPAGDLAARSSLQHPTPPEGASCSTGSSSASTAVPVAGTP